VTSDPQPGPRCTPDGGGGGGREGTGDEECDDYDACTYDYCGEDEYWHHLPLSGNPCWVNGYCVVGECVGEEKDCDDANECTFDYCDLGVCQHFDFPDGVACALDDWCILDASCVAGWCLVLSERDCDDGNVCTVDDCINEACVHDPAPEGTECDDGNWCTTDDACNWWGASWGCGGEPQDCSDDEPCTIDTCDAENETCIHEDRWPPVQPPESCASQGCYFTFSAPALIFVNNDDDSGNGVEDRFDEGPVQGEDDLLWVPMSFPGCPPSTCPDEFLVCAVAGVAWWWWHPCYSDADKTGGRVWGWRWPPPAGLYVEGRSPTDACGVPLHVRMEYWGRDVTYCCLDRGEPIVVVQVTSLTWEKRDGTNLDLDNCPNNGGLRTFPDKLTPDDPWPQFRRQVKLVAQIAPPIPGITLHFRVWDVDDPFDQLHGPHHPPEMVEIPGVEVIDSDRVGNDNRGGADPAEGTYTANTDADGRATVVVTVSMQPGNNYRAGASCLADALDQVDQADADALSVDGDENDVFAVYGWFSGYQVPVVWSRMLTVWRKLHVETDSMARPAFTQNTFVMPWNEPRQGVVATQVAFDVDDPAGGFQTVDEQFTSGYVELRDPAGVPVITARVVTYDDDWWGDDTGVINLPDCGGGVSGLACLQGVQGGESTFSDDDLSEEGTFTAKVWGCNNSFADPGAMALATPDLSALAERYQYAYILPVHETSVSGTGGLATFLQNISFGSGLELWDQALPVRNLPVSAPNYWTAMVLAAWQAEVAEDMDPDAESASPPGITMGISSHDAGETTADIGYAYTGMCAVFRAVVGEINDRERFTIAHEIGHTFGLPHNPVQPGDPPMGMMDPQGDGQLLPLIAVNLERLREYTGP